MSNQKIKTIFIGTSDFGVSSLEALIKSKNFEIVQIITQPDKKIGRKQILTPPPIKIIAKNYNINVDQPIQITNFKLPITNIDLIVLISYAQIIPKYLLEAPKYGIINVHASLLPKYRGAACIQWPIINGDSSTGVTIMKMDEGLDTGPIIYQKETLIKTSDTAKTLHDKLAKLSSNILIPALEGYVSGKIKPIPQDNKKASYVKKLDRKDGKIDWHKPAKKIERFIRAMTPWPSAFNNCRVSSVECRIIKILEATHRPVDIDKYKPGELFVHNDKLAVRCGQGALLINKLQLEGKKTVSGDEFIRGYGRLIGVILK